MAPSSTVPFTSTAIQFFQVHAEQFSCTITAMALHVHSSVTRFFVEKFENVCEAVQEWQSSIKTELLTRITHCVVPAINKYSPEEAAVVHEFTTTFGFRSLLDSQIFVRELNMQIDYPEQGSSVCLNGVQLKPFENKSSGKTIVYVMPNGALWEEQLEKLQSLVELTEATVLCYNYRQVGKSTGPFTSQEDAIDDTMAITRSLIQQGIRPFIHGFSLGGGIGMQVVSRLQEEGIILNQCNERSFESLPAVVHFLFPWLIAAIATHILKWAHWTLESDVAVKGLRGKVIIMTHKADPIIGFSSQLKRACESHNTTATIDYIEMSEEEGTGNGHVRDWFDEERKRYRDLFHTM